MNARPWLLLLGLATGSPAAAFEADRLDFSLQFKGLESRHSIMTLAVLSGETLDLQLRALTEGPEIVLEQGEALAHGNGHWRFSSPSEPGLHVLTWRRGEQRMQFNILVMRDARATRNGVLNGYRIGNYPGTALRGLSSYDPPGAFVEVTPELLDLQVSPHFTLGQFLCKQESAFPKYLLLRSRLLLKLEYLLEEFNAAGFETETLTLMSAYRTPWYNRAIGNNTRYSRHLYGGAADIFIDRAPADGVMDDLNGDGRIDLKDADVLHRLIERLSHRAEYRPFIGGLARYRANAAHGPFVHIDVRGERARWGTAP